MSDLPKFVDTIVQFRFIHAYAVQAMHWKSKMAKQGLSLISLAISSCELYEFICNFVLFLLQRIGVINSASCDDNYFDFSISYSVDILTEFKSFPTKPKLEKCPLK